jgi:hypothetical protein
LKRLWRRDRDSNPGYLAVYTLSKRAPSATRPSLRRVTRLDDYNRHLASRLPRTISSHSRIVEVSPTEKLFPFRFKYGHFSPSVARKIQPARRIRPPRIRSSPLREWTDGRSRRITRCPRDSEAARTRPLSIKLGILARSIPRADLVQWSKVRHLHPLGPPLHASAD